MKSYEISVEIRAEHVKTIRKLRKQSQAALAKSAGISPAYLCLIEKGKQKTATNTVAMKIATALVVEPEEICSGYVEPKEDTENLLTAAEREQYAVAYLGACATRYGIGGNITTSTLKKRIPKGWWYLPAPYLPSIRQVAAAFRTTSNTH